MLCLISGLYVSLREFDYVLRARCPYLNLNHTLIYFVLIVIIWCFISRKILFIINILFFCLFVFLHRGTSYVAVGTVRLWITMKNLSRPLSSTVLVSSIISWMFHLVISDFPDHKNSLYNCLKRTNRNSLPACSAYKRKGVNWRHTLP